MIATEEDFVIEQIAREAARRHMLDFTTYTFPEYYVNWHHAYLCAVLDDFVSGKIPRLMVTMPPRHGKSELVSRRLPAYIFGNFPDAQIIAASYSATLATDMNRDVQNIMGSPEYASVFPRMMLPEKNVRTLAYNTRLRNADMFQLANPRFKGKYVCSGVGGPITGRGAHYLLIDDPIKNAADADSPVIRESHWKWYTSTARTRLEKGGCVLLTLTRWHEDDLAGRLLKLAEEDPGADQWFQVNFPATREDMLNVIDPRPLGGALWPEKYSMAELMAIKASVGPRVWISLYQQRPAPDKGGFFPVEKLVMVEARREHVSRRIRYWDRAATRKKGDYTSGTLQSKDTKGIYDIEDVVRIRGNPTDVEKVILATATRDGKEVEIGIEEDPGSAGKFESNYYSKVLAGYIVRVVPVRDNKAARARPLASQMDAGNVRVVRGPWNGPFLHELTLFPFGENDDQVDSASGGFTTIADSTTLERLRMLSQLE